jgi:hypothetical protein
MRETHKKYIQSKLFNHLTSNVSKRNEIQKNSSTKLEKSNRKKILKNYIFDSIIIVQTYVHSSFFFFTTLSSPVLKCDILEMCVCARLPACLTAYVDVCVLIKKKTNDELLYGT